MASIATMEAIMIYRTLIALLIALFAGSTMAQTDKNVDCKKVPDHPNCSPRA
jgi:hypothetical protein